MLICPVAVMCRACFDAAVYHDMKSGCISSVLIQSIINTFEPPVAYCQHIPFRLLPELLPEAQLANRRKHPQAIN